MKGLTRREFLKTTVAAGVGLSTASLAAACAPMQPVGSTTPGAVAPTVVTAAAKTKLVVGISPIPQVMHPHLDSGATATHVYREVYETLVNAGTAGGIEPWLAESWRNIDPLTWEFKIRPGVKFHNGEVFDAAAAKWNLDWARDPNNKSIWNGRVSQIASTEAVDSSTLRIKTSAPYGAILDGLTIIWMMAPAHHQAVGTDGFKVKPVGTGPYKVEEFVVDQSVRLSSTDNSWQGKPTIKEITFKNILESSALLAAIQTGEVDVSWNILPEYVQGLREKGLKVMQGSTGYQFQLWMKNWWEPFNDKRVRQAMNYAVDIEAMFQGIILGAGERLQGQMGNTACFGYNPEVKPYPFDPDMAKKLLDEAGAGSKLEFVCQNYAEGKLMKSKEVCEATAEYLSKIGVTMNIETIETAQASAKYRNGTFGPMHTYGYQVMPAMSEQLPYSGCMTGNPAKMVVDAEFDRRFKEQEQIIDPVARKKKMQEFTAWVKDFCPAVFMWSIPGIYAMNPKLENYEPLGNYRVDYVKTKFGG